MIPVPSPRPRTPRAALRPLVAAVAVAALVLAGCSTAATFAPDGPCVVDGRAAGTYPALEALVRPATLAGKAPTTVDSGRTCFSKSLGSLIAHGVSDLRSAGATWDEGSGFGTTLTVLALPSGALPVAWATEFYQTGAEIAKRTEQISTSTPTFDGVGSAWRLDVLNDLSFQSIVVWGDRAIARVVIVATPVRTDTSRAMHDERVRAAVAAMVAAAAAAPAPSAAPTIGPASPAAS